jgi:hypothetical protein
MKRELGGRSQGFDRHTCSFCVCGCRCPNHG